MTMNGFAEVVTWLVAAGWFVIWLARGHESASERRHYLAMALLFLTLSKTIAVREAIRDLEIPSAAPLDAGKEE